MVFNTIFNGSSPFFWTKNSRGGPTVRVHNNYPKHSKTYVDKIQVREQTQTLNGALAILK